MDIYSVLNHLTVGLVLFRNPSATCPYCREIPTEIVSYRNGVRITPEPKIEVQKRSVYVCSLTEFSRQSIENYAVNFLGFDSVYFVHPDGNND